MRQNSQEFNIFNQSKSKDLRLVIMLAFDEPIYFSSHADIPNLPENAITDTLKSTSSISQSINPDVARAEIGKLTFSLLDLNGAVTQAFRNANAQNQGLNGLTVKLYRGGIGMDFADFRLEQTQQVDKNISYNNSVYSITCADIQRKLRTDIFDLAKTQLSRNCLNGDETIEVATTEGFEYCDHVASFSDRPTGKYIYLKVYKGDVFEIVRATGKTATTFTGITRGLFGTNDITHTIPTDSTDDNGVVVEEYVYIELPIPVMAYAMLTGNIIGGGTIPANWHLGIDADKVNIDAFINIGEDLFDENDFSKGFITYFSGLTKTDGKTFIEKEICLLMGAFMPVLADGRLSLKLMSSVLSDSDAVAELNEDNIISHSKITYDHSKIHNQLEINWAYLQFVGQDAQFYRKYTLLDNDSINKHGLGSVYQLSFKGLHSSRHTITHIHNLFDSLRDRYAGPPVLLTATLLPSMNDLEQGDIVRVKLPQQRDFMGFDRISRAFEVQKVSVSQDTGKVTVSLFGSSDKASAIVESDANNDWAIQDEKYIQGLDLSTVLNINAGVLETSATLAGTVSKRSTQAYWDSIIKNSTTNRKLYYFEGDLTIPQGVTLTLWDNVGLLVRGHLQVDGGIKVKKTPDEYVTSGYLGVTVSQGGFVFGEERSGSTNGYHIVNAGYDTKSDTFNSNLSVPALNITQDQYGIHGVPGDMCGTSGKRGCRMQDENGVVNGGEGGPGGGSLLIIARGVAFGVSGYIDTSGEDGLVGSLLSDDTQYYSGSGAGGAPGALVILIDGINSSFPVLTNVVKAKFGLSPLVGNALGSSNGPFYSTKYLGKSQTRENLGINAVHIQYAPQYREPYPTQEELLSTLKEVTGLIYSPLTNNLNQGLLSWNAVSASFNAKYRVKLFDDNGGYIWIKYAENSSGSNMSDSATGKTHIGFAINQESSVKSTTVTDYQWFVIDSSFGYQVAGLQGEPRFIWVKYATNLQGNNHADTHAGNSYIGIAINKRSNTKSASATDYLWFSAFGSAALDHNNNPTLISNQLIDDNELYISGLGVGKYRASVAVVTNELFSAYRDVLIEITQTSLESVLINYDDERISNTVAAEAAQTMADLAKTQANAYADGIVTTEETRAIADAQTKADAAQLAAINAAALDAQTKADAAKSTAISTAATAAQTKADLAKVQANAYADGIVSAEEERAIADATAKAAAAESAAKTAAAIDAQAKANAAQLAAINAAALDAQTKADAAQSTAISTAETAAQAKADLAKTQANAYADGIVSAEEERAIADATAKADAAESAAKTAAAIDAQAKADAAEVNAINAAALAAQAKINLAKTQSEAYADGVVSAEEARAIADAQTKADAAESNAIAAAAVQAQTAENNAKSYADGQFAKYTYLSSIHGTGAITTTQFIAALTNAGCFNGNHNVFKASWSYAAHGYISDTSCGIIDLAGVTIEVIGTSATYMVRVTSAPTVNEGGAKAHTTWEYRNHGSTYNPAWRMVLNSGNFQNSITQAFINSLSVTALKLATARTISLAGDVSGSTTFDGSANIAISVTVKDDSHNHVVANVDGLQTALDLKVGFNDLTYDGSTTYAVAMKSVQQFKDWLQSGKADTSGYDLVTPAMATAFINAVIGQFNIVVADGANIGVLDSRIIDVDELFARDITASNIITGAKLVGGEIDGAEMYGGSYRTYTKGSTTQGKSYSEMTPTNIKCVNSNGDQARLYDDILLLQNAAGNSLIVTTAFINAPETSAYFGRPTTHCDKGVFGNYNSNYAHHIWGMGTAYKINSDGSDFGNLYGMAYMHTNKNSRGIDYGNMAGGHMGVWCQAGVPYVAFGTNFWAKNQIISASTSASAIYTEGGVRAKKTIQTDGIMIASAVYSGGNTCWHNGNKPSLATLDVYSKAEAEARYAKKPTGTMRELNGIWRDPNTGFTIQWGYIIDGTNSGDYNQYSFSTSFTACYGVQLTEFTERNDGSAYGTALHATTTTAKSPYDYTSTYFRVTHSGASTGFNWIAYGYIA